LWIEDSLVTLRQSRAKGAAGKHRAGFRYETYSTDLYLCGTQERLAGMSSQDNHSIFYLSLGRPFQEFVDFPLYLDPDLLVTTFLADSAGNVANLQQISVDRGAAEKRR
jgi:hypothetical protein